MPKRRTIAKTQAATLQCSDCVHSYDWNSQALDGHLILCRCPMYKDGQWCKFLSDVACEHFTQKA